MNRSSIQKINNNAYFLIDLPSYLGTIITYDHTLANQTIYSDYDIHINEEFLGKSPDKIPEEKSEKKSDS